jgi:hypothetical protein
MPEHPGNISLIRSNDYASNINRRPEPHPELFFGLDRPKRETPFNEQLLDIQTASVLRNPSAALVKAVDWQSHVQVFDGDVKNARRESQCKMV